MHVKEGLLMLLLAVLCCACVWGAARHDAEPRLHVQVRALPGPGEEPQCPRSYAQHPTGAGRQGIRGETT